MSVTMLQLTAHDPIIARDGRPFGVGQGNRMRGLSWPLPSVVAGSFRTALVKANPGLDFSGDMPGRLMAVEVAGVFPTVGEELYLPAPNDCVWDGDRDPVQVHAVKPVEFDAGGCDLPAAGLQPVMLSMDQSESDFKPWPVPAWWPVSELTNWLLEKPVTFGDRFLGPATLETRDHVRLDAATGAAAEGQLFTTTGLNVSHLRRHAVPESRPFHERFAEIALSARVTIAEQAFEHVEVMDIWHPLGGERRLVHWRRDETAERWKCPEAVKSALGAADRVRMLLASPAVFENGWRPGWLDENTLIGKPIVDGPTLKLVGVCIPRWRAVSGWSLAKPRGPKPIRRMVPAGGVYFFEKIDGDGHILGDNGWLRPVSDALQDCRDGFGLAVWGVW